MSSSDAQLELQLAESRGYDPATRFLYAPHTISALLLGDSHYAGNLSLVISMLMHSARKKSVRIAGVVLIGYYSGAFEDPPSNVADHRSGLLVVACVYIAYSALQGPESVMVRPHPTMWKIVHGASMVYLAALLFMVMQGADEARRLMTYIDPSLGVELPERAYGGDCRLWIEEEQAWNLEVVKETLFDEFVIAHTLGWWAKAIMLRNYWMLWTCSIGFELMEQTFQHWLLNFNECWWDSWILDVALCNFGGMLLGMATVKYFGSRRYNWQGISKQKGVLNKARRGLLQFTPESLEVWQWSEFSSPARFLQALTIVAGIMACELNAFFLKTLLWVPPPHFLNVARLTLWFFLGLPAIKEIHTFLNAHPQGERFNKLGPFAWLAMAVLAAEILLIVKLGHGEFTAPFPQHVQVAWFWASAGLAVVLVTWQVTIWVRRYFRGAAPSKTKAS